jgi:hypothetical protein
VARQHRLPPSADVPVGLRRWIRREVEPAIRPGKVVDHTFGAAANTEERVRHGLGSMPQGFQVIDKSAACDVYTSKAPDRFYLYLRSTVGSVTVRLRIA